MRIFQNCMEAIKEIQRDAFEMGTMVHPESMQDIVTIGNEDFKTQELMGYAYMILDGSDKNKMLELMGLPVDYATQEFSDRVNNHAYPLNPGFSWKQRPEIWTKFMHFGLFSYTYNERFHVDEQLDKLIEELKLRPNTRQAILQIWDRDLDLDNLGGKSRVPCSLMYQFIIRDGALHLHYFQRSCDLLTHMPYDIWFAIAMKDYVAQILRIKSGRMHHYVTSLHAYHKDLKAKGIF